MNMLNAAFARAQIQARADATQAQAHAQARYRALPMLGQYPAPTETEPDKGPVHAPAASGRDKENASVEQGPSGRRRPSAGYAAEEGQVLNGLGFSKANGSGVLRKEIGNIAVPPEAVTLTRTKKDRKSSKRKSTFHLHLFAPYHLPVPLPPTKCTLEQRRHRPRLTSPIRHVLVRRYSARPNHPYSFRPLSVRSRAGSRVSSTGARTPSLYTRTTP
jgi:hypothetical protein